MKTTYINITPFSDQLPGTSGLRKPVSQMRQDHYRESFIQAIFDTLGIHQKHIVIGGDGRFLNTETIQLIIKMAIAQGVATLQIGQDGLLSTPAASHIIRKYQADYGIILSASHNPGGADGDFGIKVNLSAGQPAPASITTAIYQTAKTLHGYTISDLPDIDLHTLGTQHYGDSSIQIISTTQDYVELMQSCFDFEQIKSWIRSQGMAFDALHAITGPYAKAIFVDLLNMPELCLIHATPLPDFGHQHPDPTPTRIKELNQFMSEHGQISLGAASDGDGDRNLIRGQKHIINACDSLAVITANHQYIPCLRQLSGVARSMPTSRALDEVARTLKLKYFETPTGWKFFANLLDAGLIQLCGEESFGTGGAHIREKDGIWAILCWLNILAATNSTPDKLIEQHWLQYGKHHFNRFDYTALESEQAQSMLSHLAGQLPKYLGQTHHGLTITGAGPFNYTDPTNGEKTDAQGLQIIFGKQARIILRLSGTDTRGVTLRIYCEYWQQNYKEPAMLSGTTATLAAFAQGALNIAHYCNRTQPNHIV